MYKINNEVIENEKAYLDFANAWIRKPDGEKIEKYAPRIYVEGTDKNGKQPRIMIETFISEDEIRTLKINEKIDLKDYIMDVILFTNHTFDTGLWPDNEMPITATIERISQETINIKANIEEFNLVFDVKIEIPRKN